MTYWVSYYIKSNGRDVYNTSLFQSSVAQEVTVEPVTNGWYKVTRRATESEVRNCAVNHVISLEITVDEILIRASMEVARRHI